MPSPHRHPKGVADPTAAATATATRRAPYSDNPRVGARGLRTQQRILDAALSVVGEVGYERTTIDRIAQVAGCSRVSVYQYFSDKADVFRHLAGQVARQLRASAEALEMVTPDDAGGRALRAWVGRYTDVHARYEPVFRAFGSAAGTDPVLAGASVGASRRDIALFQSRVAPAALAHRRVDRVVGLLLAATPRTLDIASILRAAAPDAYSRDRVEGALTDVIHRSLFSARRGVNVRDAAGPPAPTLVMGDALVALFARAAEREEEARRPARRALAALLEVGSEVFVRSGYQGTRVDDLAAAAGVSHGAFYKYFDNKDDLLRVVAARAIVEMSSVLAEIPAPLDGGGVDRAGLRRWLRRYAHMHAEHGTVIRVWVEAGLADDPVRADQAAAYDWGRQRTARLLRDRGFGDLDADAVVLLGVVEAFGTLPHADVDVDAAAHVIEHGLFAA